MKRNFLKILSGFILIAISYNFWSALISDSKKEKIDTIIITIENRLENFPDKRKNIIYSSLESKLQERKTKENTEIVEYIITKIQELQNKIPQNVESLEEVEESKWDLVSLDERLETEETFFESVTPHNSVILRFSRWGNHLTVINEKRQSIANGNSVFVFRNGTSDLSVSDIQSITFQLKAINPDVLIFIDQEWWLVNRYVDFESSASVESIFSEEYTNSRMNIFSASEKTIIRNLFPQNYGYFPSLWRIWVAYDSFVSDASKKNFVEIIAYIRLKTLSSNWINTYWLVADLNLWNPAITNASRSFSKHVNKYKVLIDAFIVASEKTDVSLYLKHFPGHWAWLIDSHQWVLDLTNQQSYISDNIDLFDYFLENKTTHWGLMVAHIIAPDSLIQSFLDTLSKADYVLTDDLAMQGYKKMTGVNPQGWFFSSHKILQNNNLIKVDTQYVESVY
jgi:hypothetical protein